jgi:hypothetical protein
MDDDDAVRNTRGQWTDLWRRTQSGSSEGYHICDYAKLGTPSEAARGGQSIRPVAALRRLPAPPRCRRTEHGAVSLFSPSAVVPEQGRGVMESLMVMAEAPSKDASKRASRQKVPAGSHRIILSPPPL